MKEQNYVKAGQPPNELIQQGLKKSCQLCGHVQAFHNGANLLGRCLSSTCYCGQFIAHG